MFGADVKLCVASVSLVLGVLVNMFNLVVMLARRCRSGEKIKTVAVIICSISLANVLLQTSTFILAASVWAGVLCRPDLPVLFCCAVFAWLCSSSLSFWSVAWLSVFYCVRVLSFSSGFLRALKRNISGILNVALALTFLTSCAMFAPFFSLHLRSSETLVQNVTGKAACVLGKPLFPAWVDVRAYVVVFICYLTLMPLTVMLPTSLKLVVHLCRHAANMQKKKRRRRKRRRCSDSSYLLVCRLTVALVWVYLTTLLTISLYYFHAVFASGLSADMLFLGLSFYCVSSAVLLGCSNRNLREKLGGLFSCRGHNANSQGRSNEGRSRGTAV